MSENINTFERVYDTVKDEAEPCLAGTPGCCIDHSKDHGSCECY